MWHTEHSHLPGGRPVLQAARAGSRCELGYSPEIDGLRAIAVLAVVLFHADSRLLPGGFVGVDIFFVLSGYLITRLLIEERARTGRVDLWAFYARRVRRLLPALALVVACVLVLSALLMARHGRVFEQVGESAAASMAFVANFYFMSEFGGYLDSAAERMPLLHVWSLSVEEQFYLVYPVLLGVLWRVIPTGVARWLAIFAVGSFLLAEYWVHVLDEHAFYLMPARFWELAAGAWLACRGGVRALAPWGGQAAMVGLIVLVGAVFLTPRIGYFPAAGALPAVFGTCLVLVGLQSDSGPGLAGRLLRFKPLVAIGLVSYSLYLWHWPLLAIDANLRLDPASPAWRLLLCVMALALAWMSWLWIERPFRRKAAGSPRTILVGAGVTIALVLSAFALTKIDAVPPVARAMAEQAESDLALYESECHFDAGDDVDALKASSCWSDPGRTPGIVIWGDSHALAWKPLAWKLADHRGSSAMAITMNACPPAGQPGPSASERRSEGCIRLNQLASDWVASNRPHTLILASRWPPGAQAGQPAAREVAERVLGIEGIISRTAKRTTVVVMGPLPWMKRPAPECIRLGWQEQCAQSRDHFDRAFDLVREELRRLQSSYSNVVVVDPTEFFCDERRCAVERDGYSLYCDTNHVSSVAAAAFAESFLESPGRHSLSGPSSAESHQPEFP